jgi:aspartyl-tRNA(Asn)/glutamyl-tRNA(Gln) amidotransferase subunit B
MRNKYSCVIGLEVHSQLLTNSKAFSGSSTNFGDNPNHNTDPVTLGLPGALPFLNKKLVEYAIKVGLATNCQIREINRFDRKNYFYPDLPKGYQISQHEEPICYDGYVEIELDGEKKKIGITRIHMEEDSGKSIHDLDIDTLLDFNRAGVALIEIVTEPVIRSSAEAYQYLTQLKQILLYTGVSSGNMEEGALRCDANVSVMPIGSDVFGTKTEVKNLNSFRNVEKAIEYEIKRQIELIESGGKVIQETRMWDGAKNRTVAMRTKETARDYRYFPEADLPMVRVTSDMIERIKTELPEMPLERKYRINSQYQIPLYDAGILVEDIELANYYENACSLLENKNPKNYKLISNWVMTEILRLKSEKDLPISELGVSESQIAEIVDLLSAGTISNQIAKDIFPQIIGNNKSPKKIVEEKGLIQVSDTELIESLAKKLVEDNPEEVEKFKQGKDRVLGFFVGQIMKETKGKANPQMVSDIVKKYMEM